MSGDSKVLAALAFGLVNLNGLLKTAVKVDRLVNQGLAIGVKEERVLQLLRRASEELPGSEDQAFEQARRWVIEEAFDEPRPKTEYVLGRAAEPIEQGMLVGIDRRGFVRPARS